MKKLEIQDECPLWAQELIDQLRQIEIYLGNIPKTLAWDSQYLNDVARRVFQKEEATFSEEKAHLVFRKIVDRLKKEGHPSASIVLWINARIGYEGGIAYCNEADVDDC